MGIGPPSLWLLILTPGRFLSFPSSSFWESQVPTQLSFLLTCSSFLQSFYQFPFSFQWELFHVYMYYFFFLFKIHLFFSWRKLLYRILLFSVKLQHESATGIHVCPRSWTSLPLPSPSHPSRLIHSSCLSFLKHTENSPWLSNLHPRLLSSMSISLFSISVSPLLTWK